MSQGDSHSGTPKHSLQGLEASWGTIPTALLQAELARRQESEGGSRCGSGSAKGSYNTPLHVFALILILALSTFACSFPIIVRHVPRLPVPHRFLFVSRHFGTGVLIATAFVHLLPTAFVSLTDPCLPKFWNKGYPAMAGLLAMASVLVVVGIEMFFATRGAGHVHGSAYDSVTRDDGDGGNRARRGGARAHKHVRSGSFKRFRQGPMGGEPNGRHLHPGTTGEFGSGSSENLVDGQSPLGSEPDEDGHVKFSDEHSDIDLDELDPVSDHSGMLHNHNHNLNHTHHNPPSSNDRPLTAQQQKKLLLQCLLLEAGILFHSVFIGMALSVSTGSHFLVLLVAISFHQTFEGFALGSRIAALSFPAASPKPWLMALAYGTTTPLGQAIGLGIHNLYDPASQTGLLTVGVMNAISSGLLLFAGLVELLAEDFLSDHSYETLVGRRRIEACASVVGGAGLMALVGAWA